MIRALLVDDEEPARLRLRELLSEFDDVEVVGEADDGIEALQRIPESSPDLVFLDIQMPGLTGLQVVSALQPPRPHVVFCTAYDRYAVDAFELHAVDYLLKPLKRERLGRLIQRVRETLDGDRKQANENRAARETQARLLPRGAPRLNTLQCAGICRPALDVGGDYYDFIDLGAGKLGLAVGDVSGKGLYAGLLAASLQARVQSLAPRFGDDLEGLFSEVNRLLHDSTDSNRYATLFYGVYDDATRELRYVNAGHEPPLLLRAARSAAPRILPLATCGTPVGVLPAASFRQARLTVAPGDLLLIATDGVTETIGTTGAEFGATRLAAHGASHAGAPSVEALRDCLVADVDRFRGIAPPRDDLTLVVARGR